MCVCVGGGGGGAQFDFVWPQPSPLVLPWYTQDICSIPKFEILPIYSVGK